MDHTYNVIQLQSLGDKFNTVADKVATIRTYIGNIERNDSLSDDQKVQAIAALYMDSEFKSLVSAMNGATRCFISRENDIFENQNVFEAAYRRACEEVMFSKEAIDMTMPYLTRQLNIYLGAYATMSQVYDAYEAVYGAGSLKQSREEMSLRVAGCDLYGNKVQKSIPELFAEYFNGDKFIFVYKSNNTNINLSPNILYMFQYASLYLSQKYPYQDAKTPAAMANNPLSAKQVKDLAAYCNEKKTCLFQFLFNNVGFRPELMIMRPKLTGGRSAQLEGFPKMFFDGGLGMGWSKTIQQWAVSEKGDKNIYLATGAQYYIRESETQVGWSAVPHYIYCHAINATKLGAGDQKLLLFNTKDTANKFNKMMMFFQKG